MAHPIASVYQDGTAPQKSAIRSHHEQFIALTLDSVSTLTSTDVGAAKAVIIGNKVYMATATANALHPTSNDGVHFRPMELDMENHFYAKNPQSGTNAVGINAADIAVMKSVTGYVYVYIDTVNGDDANNGGSSDPVETWARAVALMQPGKRNLIYVRGDLSFDSYHIMEMPPSHLAFYAWDGPGTATIRNVDFTSPANYCGLWFNSHCSVYFYGFNIILEAASAVYGFISGNVGSDILIRFYSCVFSQSGSNTSSLLFRSTGARLFFSFYNSPITPITGKVLYGVSSGSDPNAQMFVESDITSG